LYEATERPKDHKWPMLILEARPEIQILKGIYNSIEKWQCWLAELKTFPSRWETIYGIFCVTMSDPRNFLGKIQR
jgi:hypothetical protein